MKKILHSYGLPAAMAVLIGLSGYGFQKKSNTNRSVKEDIHQKIK